MSTHDPRVAYIGGFGRSGSTLIELAIGSLHEACPLGEVVHLWERGLIQNQRCGCGAPFHSCEFWRAVGATAFGGWERVDGAEVLALKSRVDRNRHLPRLMLTHPGRSFLNDLASYVGLYERIYEAARQVSGSSLIVDSSKHASLAACLVRSPRLDLRIVHVVRNPLGVAHSWSKTKERPEVIGDTAFMPRYSPATSSLLWDAHNSMFEVLGRHAGTNLHRVRYEDFVDNPTGVLTAVAQFVGASPLPGWISPATSSTLTLASNHTVAGNPMRFTIGEVAVCLDDAWRTGLAPRARRTVQALTLPLGHRYGYTSDA